MDGIIGAGKSTATKMLAEILNLRPYYEPVESNPYLERFYQDPKRWSFSMQIHLLMVRYQMQLSAMSESMLPGSIYNGCILDRGLPGDRVFAKMLTDGGFISELEWQTYQTAYDSMTFSLRPPSKLIYLDVAPGVALERILKRNRNCETKIDLQYLCKLETEYQKLIEQIKSGRHTWAQGMTVEVIDWNELDNSKLIDAATKLRV